MQLRDELLVTIRTAVSHPQQIFQMLSPSSKIASPATQTKWFQEPTLFQDRPTIMDNNNSTIRQHWQECTDHPTVTQWVQCMEVIPQVSLIIMVTQSLSMDNITWISLECEQACTVVQAIVLHHTRKPSQLKGTEWDPRME